MTIDDAICKILYAPVDCEISCNVLSRSFAFPHESRTVPIAVYEKFYCTYVKCKELRSRNIKIAAFLKHFRRERELDAVCAARFLFS